MSRLTRAAVPPLELLEGELIAGRYRLLSRVDAAPAGSGRPAALWLARDELLTRRIAVKVLACEPGGGSASRLLAAAAAAGAVTSPALARVYDAALEQRPSPEGSVEERDLAYVVREWIDGRSLTEALEQEGPLPPAAAVALTATLADALAEAHARGLAHGRLHPGNVLVSRGGVVRVTDLAVSAALPGGAAPAGRAQDGDDVADDVRDLAALLYALLTGRWPVSATPQPAGGLPPAPVAAQRSGARGRLTGPRSVGPAVPPALDAVVRRALDPSAARAGSPLTTTSQLVDALEEAMSAGGGGPSPQGAQPRRGAVRGRLPAVGVLAVLGALGAGAFVVGSTVGNAGPGAGGLRAAAEDGTAAQDPASGRPGALPDGAGVPALADRPALPLSQADVTDFDPQGDGRERPGTVAAAVDGDPSTAWTTERYDSAAFGSLKEGVGLLLDLGTPTAVSALELALSRPGLSVELRGAASRGSSASSYRLLAHGRADGDRVVLEPPEGTRERFYLVWLTDLAVDGGRFSAGVDELVLRDGAGRSEGRGGGG